jgi:hypothetical protein
VAFDGERSGEVASGCHEATRMRRADLLEGMGITALASGGLDRTERGPPVEALCGTAAPLCDLDDEFDEAAEQESEKGNYGNSSKPPFDNGKDAGSAG